MSRHFLISPSVDIVHFIGDILIKNGSVSRSMVIFPGKRPAHFILKYLADKLQTPFIPPKILSADEFVDHIADRLGRHEPLVDAVDSLPVIYRMNDRARVVGANRPELTLDEFLPWGFKLFDDFEELYIEEVAPQTIKTVEALINENLPRGIRRKLNALSDLYKAFYQHLEKNRLSTRSSRYRQAADGIGRMSFAEIDQIYVGGFFALTKAEQRLFSHLANDDRVGFVFHDGPGIDRIIDDLGIRPAKTGDAPKPPKICFHKAMDGHAETFGLSQLIQKEKNLGLHDVIVLPMPDALFPVVHNTLGFVKDYNISMGYPIYRTPLNTLITALGRLCQARQGDDYPAGDYLRLVLHPYVKNVYLDKASYPTRIIFHTIEETLAGKNQFLVSLSYLEEDQALIDSCVEKLQGYPEVPIDRAKVARQVRTIHDVLIRPFDKIKDIADGTAKIIKVISFISNQSPANEHPFTESFIKAMIDGLHELQTSGLGLEKLATPAGYFRLILDYLESVKHPFTGTPVQGLQVLGFLETRSIKFDRVFMLDINEGILPQAVKEDTTLPYAVRKALQLPTPEDRERVARYYFENLIAGSRQADLFYVEAEDKEKSRFVERQIWNIQKKSGQLGYPSSEIFFPVHFGQADPRAIKKTARFGGLLKKGLAFSASGLDQYLACPLEYYYSRILELQLKKGVAEDPDALGVGGIVHKILMRFFVPKIGKPLHITAADNPTMDKIIEDAFREEYPDADRGSVYLIKSQVRRRLREFINYHEQDDQFKGTTVLECENVRSPASRPNREQITVINFPLDKKRTVSLRGYVDRIDRRGDRLDVIDYKTGQKAAMPKPDRFDLKQRADWPKTLGSVQLPVYLLFCLSKYQDVPIERMNAGLMFLGRKKFETEWLFTSKMNDTRRAELFESYRQAIAILISEILDPGQDFVATADEKNCARCDHAVICGRQWVEKSW